MEQEPQSAGKHGGDRGTPQAQKLTAEREEQVVELRLRKIAFSKIARTVGMTKGAAVKAYYRALHRVTLRHANEIVIEELETLERMESRVWREIEKSGQDTQGIYQGIDRLLNCQQRRARLLGYDAPEKRDIRLFERAGDDDLGFRRREEMLGRLTPEQRLQLLNIVRTMRGEGGGEESDGAGLDEPPEIGVARAERSGSAA